MIEFKEGMKVRVSTKNIEVNTLTLDYLNLCGNWETLEGYVIDPNEVLEVIVDDDFSGRVIDRGFNPEMTTIPTSEYTMLCRVFNMFVGDNNE